MPALLLPEVTDVTKWWEGKHQYMDPEGSHIFVFVGSVDMPNLFYNKNLVDPNEFKSYWDMIKTKWRGKIVAVDPRQPGADRSTVTSTVSPIDTICRGWETRRSPS